MTSGRFTVEEDERFRVIRYRSINDAPYLATAIFNLKPVRTPGLDTFAVDKFWRLYIDPVRIMQTWTVEQAAGVLIHEVNHVLRRHSDRFEAHCNVRLHRIWNIAGDCEINDDLMDMGLPLPEPTLPSTFEMPDGEFAEKYYDTLVQRADDYGDGVPCPACGGSGAKSDSKDGSRSGPSSDGQDDGQSLHGGGSAGHGELCPICDGTGQVDGGCGSGAGGPSRVYELAPDDPEVERLDPVNAEIVRRQTARDILDHQAKSRGTVPGGMKAWADAELLPPKVDWRRALAGAVRSAVAHKTGQVDFSYKRPGRRRIPRVVSPSMQRPIPHIAVVVDTSGSMSSEDLVLAVSEVAGIARRVGIRGEQLKVLAVDADLQAVTKVRDPRKIDLSGRGGTDMTVGIDYATNTLKPQPDVIVVLTDGWTPWPAEQGTVRVIAGIIASEEDHAEVLGGVPSHIAGVAIPTGGRVSSN